MDDDLDPGVGEQLRERLQVGLLVQRVEHHDLETLVVCDHGLDHAQQRAVAALADEFGVDPEALRGARARPEGAERHQSRAWRRVRRKVAPGGGPSRSSRLPSIRSASSEPIARPSPNPPSSLRPLPR